MAYRKRDVPLVWRCYQPGAYPGEVQVGMIEQVVAEVLPTDAEPPIVTRVVEQVGWRYLY